MAIETVLSVRGDARRTVEPDYAVLRGTLTVPPAPRADAVDALRRSQDRLIASLSELGGVALTINTQRDGLSWSLGATRVSDERNYDEDTGRHRATGNVFARSSIAITARELVRLPRLAEALTAVEHLDLDEVQWQVDEENRAWKVVRADAIRAALSKADDYAAALGGTVLTVDHVADAGLLSADRGGRSESRAHEVFTQSSLGDDGPPSLDPVPQEIRAVIEARVTARTSPPTPGD